MNPFDLRGPEFLLFYLIFALAVLLGTALVRRWRESGPPPRLDLADPYLVAMLRGGPDEAIRVAIVSLVDRELLAVGEELWRTTDHDAAASLAHPLERALLARFRLGDRPASIRGDHAIGAACGELGERLEALGLLAGREVRQARKRLAWLAVVVMLAPAAIKLWVAAERGHKNVQLLLLLAIIAGFAASMNRGGRLTARGKRVLADLRHLFADLRRRAGGIRAGGATSELTLLAAVFGLAAVPTELVPQVPALVDPRAAASAGDGGGFSGSSSCSSSCGSSCGGGGCGGGCGGCGS